MAQTVSFVRKIIHKKEEPLCVILYEENQIQDLKRFCVTGKVVLCVDKTYNLGKTFVTVTVFKHLSVLRQNNSHPLFLGPIFLHGKSDFKTYYEFFNCLSFELKAASFNHLIVGTDDEQALHKAITKAFPDCQHILCIRHLKANLQHYLTHKTGAKLDIRNKLISLVFSLLKSKDDIEFEVKKEEVLEKCKSCCADIIPYLNSRLIPLITEKVWNKRHIVSLNWNNNNAESFNHVLKCKTNWQQLSLPNLIKMLQEEVTSQYKDLEKAIVKLGPFKLSEKFQKFQLTYMQWSSKSEKEKEKHINAFMSKTVVDKSEGMSTDLTLITCVTVVALTRFELRFVVASSRCRVSAFTCALASERVIAKCMLLVMTSHCLLLLHHLSLCQPKFVFFLVFRQQTDNIIIFLFVLHLNRRRKGHHSSLKLCSSNVKYFCFVFV